MKSEEAGVSEITTWRPKNSLEMSGMEGTNQKAQKRSKRITVNHVFFNTACIADPQGAVTEAETALAT